MHHTMHELDRELAARSGAGDGAPTATDHPARREAEDGSLVTEYGLLAVVAATIAGVMISWASSGRLVTLFNALINEARSLVGA